jgi:hypothetical protein
MFFANTLTILSLYLSLCYVCNERVCLSTLILAPQEKGKERKEPVSPPKTSSKEDKRLSAKPSPTLTLASK